MATELKKKEDEAMTPEEMSRPTYSSIGAYLDSIGGQMGGEAKVSPAMNIAPQTAQESPVQETITPAAEMPVPASQPITAPPTFMPPTPPQKEMQFWNSADQSKVKSIRNK